MNGKILVVAAVRQELAAFRPADGQVSCRLTGMGAKAGKVVETLLSRGSYRLVVSAGFAGGAQPGSRVGDLVVASEVIDLVSGRVSAAEPVGSRLKELARQGSFITVDRVLSGPVKSDMGRKFGAIAVDMETAAVADAAERAGVPWVGLRAILDPVEISIPISSWPQAAARLAQPWRWGDVRNLIGSVRLAGESLGVGLKVLVEETVSRN